ncbi:MAG: cell division protein SepF [Firmicutes bacterium]|nr:cell division protein SepF [Bacillota bacterium]
MAVAESIKRFVFGSEKEDRRTGRRYEEDDYETERIDDYLQEDDYEEGYDEEGYVDDEPNDIGSFFKGLFGNRGGKSNRSARGMREDDVEIDDEPIGYEEPTRRGYSERTSYRSSSYESSERRNPARIVLVRATGFNEAKRISENLKNGYSVVVNFEDLDKREAQRLMDFMSGTTFAKGGKVQKLSHNTLIFAVGPVDLVGSINKAREVEEEFFAF